MFSITKKIKKLCFVISSMYRKLEIYKISYIFGKTLFLCIICSKCKNKNEY